MMATTYDYYDFNQIAYKGLAKCIDQIESIQRELLIMYNTNSTDTTIKKNCMAELHKSTITLDRLHKSLRSKSKKWLNDEGLI